MTLKNCVLTPKLSAALEIASTMRSSATALTTVEITPMNLDVVRDQSEFTFLPPSETMLSIGQSKYISNWSISDVSVVLYVLF